MSDDQPEPQLPTAATSTAEPASVSGASQSEQQFTPQLASEAEPLAAKPSRRSSESSAAEMQLDNYSVSKANHPALHSVQHNSPDQPRLIDNQESNISSHSNNESESLRHSLSSTSLSRPAQFTFSKPDSREPDSYPLSGNSTFETTPVMAPVQLQNTPSQTEEDICMSESPRPEESERIKSSPRLHGRSADFPDGQFREPGTPSSQHYYAQRLYERSSTHPSQSATPPADSGQQQSRPGSESTVQRTPEGVSMPARSAVLYHAGYNSGRGAVWRFFKVVEARVSGNTDRAECLLCHKRMLGKSADMKKHIVSNCPNRNEIAQDMQPILEIVKAELENPKKRAKRNSNTPYTMRSDGSFAPVSSYHSAAPEHSPVPPRMQPVSVHHQQVARGPQRGAPYDLHPAHPDAHRAKMIKYSREHMHGGSGSHFDGPSGGSDHPGHYPHGSSAMPMPPPGHQIRQPMGQEMNMRMRSPGSGFAPRHGGHPMAPPMQQQQTQHPPPPISTSHQQPVLPPPQQQQQQQQQPGMGPPPIAHHSSRQTPISPSQQPHTPRYYPPGPSGQLPPSNQLPQPHSMGQRQGGPVSAHGMSSQRPSPTKSPQMAVSNRPLARLKSKMQRQIPVFGVWLTIPSPVTARILAAQGFDWACIDMEHTPTNPSLMAEMVAAVAGSGTCAPIVRVPSHAPEWFKWALDAGAHGIIVPMVNTVEELRNVERLCRYPPTGKRSMGAFFAPNAFGLRGPRAMNDYVDNISDDILIIPQIESVEGVRNLSSMLKGGGIDAVFVGPYDLNASVRSTQDMQIQEVMAHLERVTKENDIPIGIYASSGAAASSRLRDGYTFLVAASDIECLSSSAADNLDRAKSGLRPYH